MHKLFIIDPCRDVQDAVHCNGRFLVIRLQDGEYLGDDVDHPVGIVSVDLPCERCARTGGVQATVDSRDVAHPGPEERTRELLWSVMIFPTPHQLQLGKQLSTSEFNFYPAFQRDQSLSCCTEHPRGPVVRDLEIVRISRHTSALITRARRRVEFSELVGEGRDVDSSSGRIPFVVPVETLVFITLGFCQKWVGVGGESIHIA